MQNKILVAAIITITSNAIALQSMQRSSGRQQFYVSKLPPHETDLSSVSFFYHGFPEMVIGSSFSYVSSVGLVAETRIVDLLAGIGNRDGGILARTCTFLGKCFYWDRNGALWMTVKPEIFRAKLKQLESTKNSDDKKLLKSVCEYWLRTGLANKSDEATLNSIEDVQSKEGRRVAANIKKMVSSIQFSSAAKVGWIHPYAVR